MDSLAATIKSNGSGQKLYVSGNSAPSKELAARLAEGFGTGVECEAVEFTPGPGQSAAIRRRHSSRMRSPPHPRSAVPICRIGIRTARSSHG